MQKLLNRKGFTLIELIVVIAIIAILVGLATPRFLGYTKDANVAAMQADSKTLSNGALQFAIKNADNLPVADTPVVVAVEPDSELAKVIAEAATQQGVDASEIVLAELDQAKIGNFYKSLKNPLAKYVIVTSNDALQGEVFFVGNVDQDVLEDSVGNLNSGIYTVTP